MYLQHSVLHHICAISAHCKHTDQVQDVCIWRDSTLPVLLCMLVYTLKNESDPFGCQDS
jgi:hypothetical protein